MKKDWLLLLAVILLTLCGVSVQLGIAGYLPDVNSFIPLIIGFVAVLFSVLFLNGERIKFLLKFHWFAYLLAMGLVGALIVFGREYRGALYLPGRINPSELVKLCMVFWSAGYFMRDEKSRKLFSGVKDFFVYVCAFAFVLLGLAVVNDFGLIAQLVVTVSVMMFVCSWFWGIVSLGTIAAGAAFVAAHPFGHLAKRFAVWRDPFIDATGSSWQVLQGFVALLVGSWHGVGEKFGEVSAIPIASSDFVYAALAEEWGLIGCAVILGLWLFVFVRGLLISANSIKTLPSVAILAAGIVTSLAVQVILNVAGVLNVLPMTGITLPLISHGGSSQAVTLLFCAILCAAQGKEHSLKSKSNTKHE